MWLFLLGLCLIGFGGGVGRSLRVFMVIDGDGDLTEI